MTPDKTYYIFSDESGHWTNDNFYVRSWVGISAKEMPILTETITLFKKSNNIQGELKYKDHHNLDFSPFKEIPFKAYFTVTFLNDFKERKFKIIEVLNKQNINIFRINGISIKKKVLNDVRNSIFLNIFEYYHIENAVKYFNDKISRNAKQVWRIDIPQYNQKNWKDVFRKLTTENHNLEIIRHSEEVEGIQFADILAGTIKEIVSNRKIDGPFEEKLVKMFDFDNKYSVRFLNNPQIVMWKPEHQKLIDNLKAMRDGI